MKIQVLVNTVLVGAVFLGACGPLAGSENSPVNEAKKSENVTPIGTTGWNVASWLYRIVDDEAGVVCYTSSDLSVLNCMPMSSTLLAR